MLRYCAVLISFAFLLSAADPWIKVRELKSGSDVKIFKRGVKQPLEGKFDQLTDESVVVALKSEQTAISKDEVERIDARPARTGSLLTRESTIKQETGRDGERAGPRPNPGTPGPSSSTSSGLTINNAPSYQTIYRRLPDGK